MTPTHTILAVDDDPTNLFIMQEAFGDDYNVETARGGVEAIRLAQQSKPSVMLLDVKMPGQSGYEVCRRVRSLYNLSDCRIIMVSGMSSLRDCLQGYEAGADDYVTKPFDESELRTKIAFAIRAKRLQESCGPIGEVLSFMANFRDAEMISELERVREISRVIAMELRNGPYGDRITQQFLDDLHYSSMLCDVGLLAVPEQIRNRMSMPRIDPSLQQHTLVGSQLLRRLANQHPDVSLFNTAADTARSHHEHYDGTGYPDQLCAEQIPLIARIVGLAMECEFLCSVYSEQYALSEHQIEQRISEEAGGKFDPVVTSAFTKVFEDLMELA